MANLRFPETLDGESSPWILFSSMTPSYNRRVNDIKESGTGDSVGLYFPTGLNISDDLNYDTGELGLLSNAAINRISSGGGGAGGSTLDNIKDLVTTTAKESTANAGGRAKRKAASIIGAESAYNRATQTVSNPQEFMLFNSPGMRSFSFSFSFLPQSQSEADTVPQIIRFFRRAAYPVELNTLEYQFPNTFAVSYSEGTSNNIIKMPELACTSVGVTYNPNSMSYFTRGNQPVETTLELSFTELRPISRSLVEEGF